MSRPSPGAPPQRVCPHCATLAYSAESHCPFCGRAYKRRIVLPVAALLLVTAAVVLGGVALMFVAGTEGRWVRREARDAQYPGVVVHRLRLA